jgi:hypothetical protein
MLRLVVKQIASYLAMTKAPAETIPTHSPNSPLFPLPTHQDQEGYLSQQVIFLLAT